MTFAIKDGILWDNSPVIAKDLQELVRLDVNIHLIHNLGNRDKDRALVESLPASTSTRVEKAADFHSQVIELSHGKDKVVFLERQCVQDGEGNRMNVISTLDLAPLAEEVGGFYDAAGCDNKNLRSLIEASCECVLSGDIGRIHIVPIFRNRAIRQELFSLDGIGTIIERDFSHPQIEDAHEDDDQIIQAILQKYKGEGHLKPRSVEYISDNIGDFYVARIDGIPVGCVEAKQLDDDTIELAALAVMPLYLTRKIGRDLIQYVERLAIERSKSLVVVTPNTRLQASLERNGYVQDQEGRYQKRAQQSPNSVLYVRDFTS